MKDQHTPGNWYVVPSGRLGGTSVITNTGDKSFIWIARVAPVVVSGKGSSEANGRLMAAAPDLLAALIAITKWCELAFDPEHATYRIPDEVKQAHVAIAKASGKSAQPNPGDERAAKER